MAGSKESRYTVVPNSLERLLQKIPTLGTPEKANAGWLGSIGMGGGNNQSMLRVLKSLGVVGSDGVPTKDWAALRAHDRTRIAALIRRMYADLFAVYPDANQKDAEALLTFFRSNTNLGERAQRLSVQTFQVLCRLGDFSADGAADAEAEEGEGEAGDGAGSGAGSGRRDDHEPAAPPVALTVNLQLALPPSADGEVYDKLFAAMATHLRGLVAPE